MPKVLCWVGIGLSILIFLLFFLDLVLPFALSKDWAPLKGASMMVDIVFVLSAVGLGFLSWVTLREQD